jgi:hypothetical protein
MSVYISSIRANLDMMTYTPAFRGFDELVRDFPEKEIASLRQSLLDLLMDFDSTIAAVKAVKAGEADAQKRIDEFLIGVHSEFRKAAYGK